MLVSLLEYQSVRIDFTEVIFPCLSNILVNWMLLFQTPGGMICDLERYLEHCLWERLYGDSNFKTYFSIQAQRDKYQL